MPYGSPEEVQSAYSTAPADRAILILKLVKLFTLSLFFSVFIYLFIISFLVSFSQDSK